MYNGAFDDRNDARLGVKEWLEEHAPQEYTRGNICLLACEMVQNDLDPVDDVRMAWRETSYGIVKGIVEYAAEQVEGLLKRPSGAPPSSALSAALKEMHSAVVLLPRRAATAIHSISAAAAHLKDASALADMRGASAGPERPLRALNLALSLLAPSSGYAA